MPDRTKLPNPDDHGRRTVSRRAMLVGTGAGALAGLVGGSLAGAAWGQRGVGSGGADGAGSSAADGASESGIGSPVRPTGRYQPGVARPVTPQRNALIVVADCELSGGANTVRSALANLGSVILSLHDASDPALFPDGAGDLSVTVGIGPRVLDALALAGASASLLDMPDFAGDDSVRRANRYGGDLLLSIAASDPGVLDPARQLLAAAVPGFRMRWEEFGFRGPGEDTIARNPFGFHDGVIVPRGAQEYAEDVWLADGPLAGGTICVIRRFELDTARFAELSLDRQNAVVGRDKVSGAPLTGGALRDEADLTAKRENGEFVLPVDSHVRAAHPTFTGSGLMLRRSYGFHPTGSAGSGSGSDAVDAGAVRQGLLFTAFQNDVRTFVRTQQRLDEVDALMAFTTPTATAAFAVLPGFDAASPLGSTLA